jgi:hypothetical protein
MYFDGSKRIQGAGAGIVLISPQGDKLKYVLRMSFPQASNIWRLKIFGNSMG